MIRSLSLAAFAALFAIPCAGGAKPDIVVYLSDDHSQYDSSVYGDKTIPMPNLGKLAAEGMKFTRCFVASPTCAPSRTAMLTGLMPARNGAEENHSRPRPDARSLVTELKAAGYETVAIGKVAHGATVSHFGFDRVVGPDRSGGAGDVVDKAAAYLAARAPDKPLCLFVGTSDPHVPWPAKTGFAPSEVAIPPQSIDGPETRQQRAHYYQGVKNVDDRLGRLRELCSRVLGPDTLFIYTSDHGAQWAFGKWTLYDYGIRIPFVAAWAGRIKPGSVSDAMISWIDLIPTLLEAGGAKVPEGIDGRSFLPVLTGAAAVHRDRIFTTHSGDLAMNVYPIRSVRTAEWKLIHNLRPDLAWTSHSDLLRRPFAGAHMEEWARLAKTDLKAKAVMDRYYQRPEFELYHVSGDPWELTNLIDDPAAAPRVARLKLELSDWMKGQGDSGKIFSEPRPLAKPETWHPDHWRKDPAKPAAGKGSGPSRKGGQPPGGP